MILKVHMMRGLAKIPQWLPSLLHGSPHPYMNYP